MVTSYKLWPENGTGLFRKKPLCASLWVTSKSHIPWKMK